MKTESKIINPNNALTWPENSPTVSMNTKLGDQGRRINFDMAQYHMLLDKEKVSGPARAKLKVNLTDMIVVDGKERPGLDGLYDSEDDRLDVRAQKRSKDESTDKTILHETKHFIQDIRGEWNIDDKSEWKEDRRKRRHVLGIALPLGTLVTGIALNRYGVGNNFVKDVEAATDMLAARSTYLGLKGNNGFVTGWLEYLTRPEEIRARRFAKKNNKHFDIFRSYPEVK